MWDECLHNSNQLKLIKVNCHFPGWAEVENSRCPNTHTGTGSCLSPSSIKRPQVRLTQVLLPWCWCVLRLRSSEQNSFHVQTCGLPNRFGMFGLATTLLLSLLTASGRCFLRGHWPQLPLSAAPLIIIPHYFLSCQWQSRKSNGLFTSFQVKYDLCISAQLNSSYINSAFLLEDFN